MLKLRIPRLTLRRILYALAVLLVVGLAAPHLWAWYHLRAARTALERYHPEVALGELERCLRVWPDRPGVRLLASRAAWQAGDLEVADHHLRASQREQGGATDDTAFEWALLHASAGHVREVEEYLQRKADEDPARAPLVWEALAVGYTRIYRTVDAMACLEHWLAGDPDNVRALELRGITYVTGKGATKGAEDFRRVLEIDPTRDDTRSRLARSLIDLGAYDEAISHLEYLLRDRPDDPELLVRLARCQQMINRSDLAHQSVERALAIDPGHALALRTRGQFALSEQEPAEAETWLRRAVASNPADYQTQWFLFQSLQQQGKEAEAAEQLKSAEQVRDQTERLSELQSRKLAEQPLDPALHYEMAVLLLRTGYTDLAERWLQSALTLDPAYRPAHAALADYYERKGDGGKAALHRERAAQ